MGTKRITGLVFLFALTAILFSPSAARAEWSEPDLLEELNDSQGNAARYACLSSDGLTMYFVRDYRLWEAYRDESEGPFTSERQISELNTSEYQYAIWVSSDGLRAYYITYVNPTVKNIIRQASRSSIDTPWTDQMSFYDIHNNYTYESRPSLTEDELTMCYSHGGKIIMATRSSINEQFSNPVRLIELEEFGSASNAWILPDGLTIYFTVQLEDGTDIYRATRPSADEPFGNLERAAISTDAYNESYPYVTEDEKTIYYCTNYPTGGGNTGIWVSHWIGGPLDMAMERIENAIGEKEDALAGIEAALEWEREVMEILDALGEMYDPDDAEHRDIVRAKLDIRQSMVRERIAKRLLLRSVRDLERALGRLGINEAEETAPSIDFRTRGRGRSSNPRF